MTTAQASPPAVGAASEAPAARPRSRLLAVGLTAIIPGAGHVYAGRRVAGLIWFALALAGYATFFLPGFILHVFCLISAAFMRPPALTAPDSAPSGASAP